MLEIQRLQVAVIFTPFKRFVKSLSKKDLPNLESEACSPTCTYFFQVDVCTPEDHHIAGMQVNGYENPTYTFYDGGATAKA